MHVFRVNCDEFREKLLTISGLSRDLILKIMHGQASEEEQKEYELGKVRMIYERTELLKKEGFFFKPQSMEPIEPFDSYIAYNPETKQQEFVFAQGDFKSKYLQ